MKLVYLRYYVGIHEEVAAILEELGLETFTRWPAVHGRVSGGEPREESHIWPGANSVIAVAVEDAAVESLLDRVRDHNRQGGDRGIDADVVDVVRCVRAAEADGE